LPHITCIASEQHYTAPPPTQPKMGFEKAPAMTDKVIRAVLSKPDPLEQVMRRVLREP
jgi:hypothetical protein